MAFRKHSSASPIGWRVGAGGCVLRFLLAFDLPDTAALCLLLQRELPLEAIEFCFVPAFLILLHHSQRLGDHPQPFFGLAALRIALGQRAQK